MNKLLTILMISVLTMFQLSCTSPYSDGDDEMAQETQNIEEGIDNQLDNPDDTAVSDSLDDSASADENQVAETNDQTNDQVTDQADGQTEDEIQNNTDENFKTDFADEENLQDDPAAESEIADKNSVSEAPMEDVVQSTQETPAYEDELNAVNDHVRVTGLDYKANENGGTIVIQTSGPAKFKTVENNNSNQYVIEILNAELPSQFQRPYNTKEFSGVVGMINAYQRPGTDTVRVIVQLKKPTPVSVVQEGNSLVVVPGAAVAATPVPEVDEDAASSEAQEVSDNGTTSKMGDGSQASTALNSKTLDEFLLGDTKFYGKKISIEIVDGEIRDVINFISEESGVNLVLSDEVKGKISVKLRQIPWDQALVVIMQTKQLGYIRQGNILRISTLASIRAETDSAKQLLDAQKLFEPLKTKVFPISYAKAKELEPQATAFLSARGIAKADERTNNLVVKDIAENVVKIEKLIQRLDTQTPQVYIEGKIVESKTSTSREIGINWTDNSEGSVGLNLSTGSVLRTGNISLTAKLALLETEDRVKILSSPRIVTLDNQLATIEQSTQFPTYEKTTDPTTKVTTTKVEYKTVKLSLKVTPQITAEGGVILKTDILREFAGAVDTRAGDTGARSLNSRSANTTILVENGNTAVLGGIYSTDNTEGNAGIPVLRKIPIIGLLFGQDKTTYDKNELLIFLTPRVINKDKAFNSLGSAEGESDSL